jgi:4-hydroxybenzoyl-CoA thioesterase
VAERTTAAPPKAVGGQIYRAEVLIRFSHCDPAGIVFFPRYLEIFNDLVEDWCRDELGFSFAEIHKGAGWGLPTVHLNVDYLAPSRIGDRLTAHLAVRKVGTSSMHLAIVLRGMDHQDRVRGTIVVVLTDPHTLRATPIPNALRQRIERFHAAD